MREPLTVSASPSKIGAPSEVVYKIPVIPVVPLGMSLGGFLTLTYILCVLFDLWFPSLAMNAAWSPLLPGFSWISWSSFLLGLVETYAYGWYVALLFAPLFNYFTSRSRLASQT